jgi:hypothetical protein
VPGGRQTPNPGKRPMSIQEYPNYIYIWFFPVHAFAAGISEK